MPFVSGHEVKSMTQVEQTARHARSRHFAHPPKGFQITQTPDELLLTYQLFFFRCTYHCTYHLQPEQLLIEEHQIFGVRTSTIPKAALQTIRVIYRMEEEGGASWHLQLAWADQQHMIGSDSRRKGTSVVWLAEVLAVWAGFALRWENPTTSAKLYERVGSVDVVHGTEPAVSSTVLQSQVSVRFTLAMLFLIPFLAVAMVLNDGAPASPGRSEMFIFTVTAGLLLLFGMNLINKLVHVDPLVRRFRQQGITTQGVITQQWITYADDPGGDVHYLAYTFPGGVETKVKVTASAYKQVQIGAPVMVRYLATEPTISQVEWA